MLSSRPLAIHISNMQSIAIFSALSLPGSFLSVLFIMNVSILSPLGPTRPVPQVLFISQTSNPLPLSVSSDSSSPLVRVWSSSFSSVASRASGGFVLFVHEDLCEVSVSFLSLLRKSGNLRKSIRVSMEILATETQSGRLSYKKGDARTDGRRKVVPLSY